MSCIKKRRESPTQQIIRLLHKTHKEVHEILAILSHPVSADFSKEDASVTGMTLKSRTSKKIIDEAKKRIPQSKQPTKGK
jgi:hypothetical protein